MKIGDVSLELGIPASAIRYYERAGLIKPPPRVSGQRHFDLDTLRILRFVKLAQAAQFSIEEIRKLLASYRDDPGPSGMWKPVAKQKREALQIKIAELQQADQVLEAMLSCQCASLSECVSKAGEQKP